MLLRDCRYCPVGRSFYSPDLGRRQPLGEGLESWRGFYQSIRPTQMGLSLNIGTPAYFRVKENGSSCDVLRIMIKSFC